MRLCYPVLSCRSILRKIRILSKIAHCGELFATHVVRAPHYYTWAYVLWRQFQGIQSWAICTRKDRDHVSYSYMYIYICMYVCMYIHTCVCQNVWGSFQSVQSCVTPPRKERENGSDSYAYVHVYIYVYIYVFIYMYVQIHLFQNIRRSVRAYNRT